MQEHWTTILQVLLAFGLAVAGGAASAMAGVSHKRLCGMISLAAGTLMGVTVFTILPEAYSVLPVWELLLALGTGYIVFHLISKYVFHVCPACAASHFDEATTHRFSEIASGLVIALAIHSTLDGLALAAGHQCGGHDHDHSHAHGIDLSLVLAICIHKVPEGLALGALLLGAGFKKGTAVMWVAAVEATTLLGGALGIWLLPGISAQWLNAVLAHVGGGFIYLAVHAVFGELVKHDKKTVLTNFGIGVALMAGLNLALRYL
jgi:zinc transporter ZupT